MSISGLTLVFVQLLKKRQAELAQLALEHKTAELSGQEQPLIVVKKPKTECKSLNR